MMKALLALAFALAALAPAHAEPPSPPASLSADELEAARGGVLTVDGLSFGFGAVVRTYADGQLALQTSVEWTDGGAVATRIGDAALANLAGTSIVQNLDGGHLSNVLANTANGRDFRQEMDVLLTLPGFDADQAGMVRALSGLRLNDDLTTASIGALR